jgi:NAD+ kinase
MGKGARARGASAGGAVVRSVLVLADGDKPQVLTLLRELERWLTRRVARVAVERELEAFDRARAAAAPRPDLVVVLGGDGAILGAVRAFQDDPVPTLGIHLGRVGFLASIEAAHWREALEEALEGRAVVEPRMRLLVDLDSAQPAHAVALNDAVVTRGAFQGMLSITLRVGSHWVTNYRADGLVVATPSGSTAYSMAAGGPILAPSMQAFVVSPVSPQALSHRPLVVDGTEALELHLSKAAGLTTLVVDGQGFYPMSEGDFVRVRRHPVPYPLLTRAGFDPFTRLRERLGWRGSIEPDVFPELGAPRPEREVDPGTGGLL